MLTWLQEYMEYTDNGSGTADGTHPNGAGYELFYLPIISNCLLNI
jgi:lysophospholipase L1-like esterase